MPEPVRTVAVFILASSRAAAPALPRWSVLAAYAIPSKKSGQRANNKRAALIIVDMPEVSVRPVRNAG